MRARSTTEATGVMGTSPRPRAGPEERATIYKTKANKRKNCLPWTSVISW